MYIYHIFTAISSREMFNSVVNNPQCNEEPSADGYSKNQYKKPKKGSPTGTKFRTKKGLLTGTKLRTLFWYKLALFWRVLKAAM